MSFPSYPVYRDSGVDWLGEVPSSWKVASLKYGYEVTLGKMLQPNQKSEADQFLPYLRAANIQPEGVNLSDVRKMWMSPSDVKNLRLIKGDLLVSEGGDVGRAALWNSTAKMFIQNSINRVRSLDDNSSKFLFYWLSALKAKGFIEVLCNKSTIAHFTAEKVSSVPTPFPKVSEQVQIARFLDHETAKIDTLIHEQKRLIELLKEKRQAVISHAVTKGLAPDVPMKDSGLEWLGEVPAHWVLGHLKRTCTVIDCKHVTAEFTEEGFPLASIREVQSRYVDLSSAKKTTAGFYTVLIGEGRKPIAGDLIISRNATVGEVAEVTDDHPEFALGQDVCLIRKKVPASDSVFLYYTLKSSCVAEQISALVVGSTFKRINVEQIKHLLIQIPPPDEQRLISQYITETIEEYMELISEGLRGITYLHERRSALISAAVTGKIDVRDWQPPADESTFDEKVRQTEMEAES